MDKNEPRTHRKDAFLYVSSRVLERAAYYGLRALIVVYMIDETLNMERSEALAVYAWFTVLMMFSHIIGGVLGDLVVGNRRAIVFGAVLQAVGAFVLCIPTVAGLYAGLALVIFGSGLYFPNLVANFGKLYLDRVKLLHSAFTFDYLAINVGAFFGVLLISYYGEAHGWSTGFAIGGVLMLASLVPILGTEDRSNEKSPTIDISMGRRFGNIFTTVLLVSLFWMVYEMTSTRFVEVQQELTDALSASLPANLITSFQSIILLPILVVVVVLWTYLYSSYTFKLMLGFTLGAMSFGMLLYLPEVPTAQHPAMYLTSLVLLGLSEALVAPMIGAVVTKYSNPKCLAIMFGLVFIPSRMFSIALGAFNEWIYADPLSGLRIGMAIMAAIGVGLMVILLVRRNSPQITP